MPLKLPYLREEPSGESMTSSFYGLNRNLKIADGEFYDMQNLTSDDAPVMEVRKRRGIPTMTYQQNPMAIITRAVGDAGTYAPVWLDGIYLNAGPDQQIDLTPYGYGGDGTGRTLVSMGAYIIVVPDMIYVNTVDEDDRGRISDTYTAPSASVWTAVVADYEGNVADYAMGTEPQGTEAEPLENGDLWHKTGTGAGLFRYDLDAEEWYSVGGYLKISGTKSEAPVEIKLKSTLAAGDTLRISGFGDEKLDRVGTVVKTDEKRMNDIPATYILVEGMITSPKLQASGTVKLERVIPKMDFVCEANNRLWGCRYGDDGSGNFVNEIYCSARGDFFRWIAGAADNDDSPVTFSVGTDGAWTGAVNYDGYPTFFKERVMYRVSGFGASGFAIYDTQCMGVDRGAQNSLAVVKNVLYYKSASAIMAFDGSLPVPVSNVLGSLRGYTGAVSGACGSKLYVSLWKKTGAGGTTDRHLYVLDTDKGLWHREDASEIESMAAAGDNMYFVHVDRRTDNTVKRTIMTVEPLEGATADEMETPRITWYAETGIIGLESPAAKYLKKVAMRLRLDAGSTVRISALYDSIGTWKQIGAVETSVMRTSAITLTPERCDHLRLRLDGIGGCQIYSITKTFEDAEDA